MTPPKLVLLSVVVVCFSSLGWFVWSMVHEWREWRAVNASASQSYGTVRGWGSSGTEEAVVVAAVAAVAAVVTVVVVVGIEDGPSQMLFGLVPILSCTWMSFRAPEPLDKSIPKSRPVQCELISKSSLRALKSTNASPLPPPQPIPLPLLACPSPLSTSITGSGAGVTPGGVLLCSENCFHEYFPCRLEGLYEHVKPFIRQRSHTGCFLSHLILAAEQASQVDRSLNGALGTDIGLDGGWGVCVYVGTETQSNIDSGKRIR